MLRRDPYYLLPLKMENITTGFISKGYLHKFQQDKKYSLGKMLKCIRLIKLTIQGVFPNICYSLTINQF